MVYLPRFGSRASTILFKYAGQWAKTARILRQERPDVTFVMSPPVVAALPALWYGWRHRKQMVIDAHTAAFVHPRWQRFQWLQRALCRRAATTLVHNEYLAEEVRRTGGHATLVPDVPVIFSEIETFRRPNAFCVAVVCSFNPDEPLAAILEAARLMPAARFFVTGNPRHFPASLAATMPDNVTLTGFLSIPAYGGLIAGADAVLTLTTRDHTMLRGAYEAIYQGTPVIVSDWPLLRASFDDGAVHVDNSPAQIAEAVRTVQANQRHFRDGAARLRQKKLDRWKAIRQSIINRIQASRIKENTGDA